MKDYGNVESSQCFSTFKYNLNAVCDASSNIMRDGKDVFYENFILSMVIHCLRASMKSINNDLLHSTGKRTFKFVYTPSVLHLLKTLNTLRRAFDLKQELTDAELLNKKTGSMMGALIKKREELLNSADESIAIMRKNAGRNFYACDAFTNVVGTDDDRHAMMNTLQTKMTVIQVLFDVYKLLSIELH